jgi:hypothetical protein
MKFARGLIILIIVFAMVGMPSPVAAQAYTYTSSFQLQNLSGTDALVTITYYSQQTDTGGTTGGTQVTSADDTISGLGSKTYFPIHAPTGFKGSVVVSSSTALASVANLVANGIGYASYVGFSSGGNSAYLPLLMKANSGYYTWVSVQNTSVSNATINVDYSDTGVGNDIGPIIIKPNASYVIKQSAETHTAKVFSGTLTSNQPVAVVVVQEGTGATKTILAAAGFPDGATNALIPLVNANNSGFKTGIQIQNIGNATTNITVSYTAIPGSGTDCTETYTGIEAGTSKTFALYAFAGGTQTGMSTTCAAGEKFVGSASITENTAGVKVVAAVNQITSKVAGAYDAFLPSQATAKVVLPLIMDRNSNWYTGFNIANVGGDEVTVNCTFTNTTYTVSGTLAPGEALNAIQKGKVKDKYVGSGSCVATGAGDKLIVGVVNEASSSASGDWLMVYEGINTP